MDSAFPTCQVELTDEGTKDKNGMVRCFKATQIVFCLASLWLQDTSQQQQNGGCSLKGPQNTKRFGQNSYSTPGHFKMKQKKLFVTHFSL